MSDNITIKRALISVYDKSNVVEIAKFLANNDIEIISTGKTYSILSAAGIKAIEISDYTGFLEIMGGRVKTLHPKIYGGILGIRSQHNFDDTPAIDLVITNLYPFSEVAKQENSTEQEIIEQIDIGGVSLIRAAAKNFHDVCVITDIADYQYLHSIEVSLDYRKKLAVKAFELVAKYDVAIAQWFAPEPMNAMLIAAQKTRSFRYGENPHQQAAFYSNNIESFPKQVQGKELSYNNIIDADSAFNLILEFTEPTVAIIKHNNPCGVASAAEVLLAYKKAFGCDSVSSFGGIVACNREITQELATCIIETFTEVVIAPKVTEEAMKVFATKPNIRVLLQDLYKQNQVDIKKAFGGILIQDEDIINMQEEKIVTKRSPTSQEQEDLYFAWKVCKHVKSNAIILAKNQQTIGIGAGQMSRVDSMKLAIEKSQSNLQGAVLASDAFFPFDDNVKLAAEVGITAIIQPGGSIRDQEVIKTADQHNITMLFTSTRHFKH